MIFRFWRRIRTASPVTLNLSISSAFLLYGRHWTRCQISYERGGLL